MHPLGPTLLITAGCGWVQRDGGTITCSEELNRSRILSCMEVGLNTEDRAAFTEIPQGKPAGFIVPRGLRGDGQRVVSIFYF